MSGPLVPPTFRDEPRWARESTATLAWLDGLEDVASRLLAAWNLTVDGASRHGSNGIAILVNTDLHPAQVMWRDGDGWCALDPRPMNGTIEYQCAQLLWTTADLLRDVGALRRGLGIVVDAAGMNPALAAAWTLVRAADYLLWGLSAGLTEDPERCRRILDALSA